MKKNLKKCVLTFSFLVFILTCTTFTISVQLRRFNMIIMSHTTRLEYVIVI